MIEEFNGLDELPQGWIRTQLGEIAEVILGQSPPSSTYNEDGRGLPFYQGKLEFGKSYPTPRKWCTTPKKTAEKGDVLISVRAPVGPTNVCPEKSCIGRGLAAIRGLGGIETLFILYLLRALENEIARRGTGTTFSAIGGDKLKELEIPLPPFNEQVRIIAKLEELFACLDAGVEGLRKVKVQLKRYRQAVLKYAFEGKLTEEWRKTHRDQIEPATKLLERIREVRKDTKFKELQPIDTIDLPILPEEWTWARIGEIAESMRNGVYKPEKFYGNNGVACLRMYNIENGAIVWKDVKRMNLTPEEIEFYELKPGDILVNRVNSRELVGKAAAIPSGLERCVYESKNIRLRLLQDYANSKYVNFWFLMYGQKFFSRNAQQTVGMASINQEQLASMPIPLCHPNEQTMVVEKIERLFSIADEVEKIATESIEHADKMRQSILKMAFEGKLVPQDPSDESAEKLLERIREEREKSRGENGINRRKNKPKQLELSSYVK